MENDILDSLNDIGYDGPLSDEINLSKALDAGPKSLEFAALVQTLADELKKLCNLEETVTPLADVDDSSSFLMELSSFLKELGCPYKSMVTGHLSSRLQNRDDRILLLDYMLSELMSARMVNVDKPKDTKGSMEIVMQESPTAKDLKDILISLKFNKPPPNITAEVLFNKLFIKLKETIDKEGPSLVGKPLYNKAISEKQWKELEVTFAEMSEDYRLRRETLLTRLECTVQSFEWSDRIKNKKDQIQAVYRAKRDAMKVKPAVRLCDFLAARNTLLHLEKTSSATVRKNTQSDVNKVIIGRVPDRGGRPSEQQPPPPDMPFWQQRSASGGGGGRGGGGGFGGPRGCRGGRGGNEGGRGGRGGSDGGGGRGGRGGGEGGRGGRGGGDGNRGGRVQGGWNQPTGGDNRSQSSASNYSNSSRGSSGRGGYQTYEVPPGGYNQNQGGYNQNQGGHNQSPAGYNQGQSGYQTQGGYNQSQSSGYRTSGQGQPGYQGRGGYQNEHDDRGESNYGGGRGRSNYNRGGRR